MQPIGPLTGLTLAITPTTFRVLQDGTQKRELTADDVRMQPNPVYSIHSTSGQHVYDDIQ